VAAPPGEPLEQAQPVQPCGYPAHVLDLSGWKLTQGAPQEVTQPNLGHYGSTPWFSSTPNCDGVTFRAPVNGATTSGSHYPRSELREMSADGHQASWRSDVGTHTLVVNEAFTALPKAKPALVGAQIHGSKDDVTREACSVCALRLRSGAGSGHDLSVE
jgi:hypothetical protein